MAANSLIDRGWGKAAQLVAVDGEIKQLVEVKLSVVSAAPASHVLPNPEQRCIEHSNINDTSSLPNSSDGPTEPVDK